MKVLCFNIKLDAILHLIAMLLMENGLINLLTNRIFIFQNLDDKHFYFSFWVHEFVCQLTVTFSHVLKESI